MVAPERGVHFAVFIEVGRNSPSAVVSIKEENHALADVDEDANLAAASEAC